MSTETVPIWPRIEAVIRPDGTGEVTVDGTPHPISTGSLDEARRAVVRVAAETASAMGRPVRVTALAPDGEWPLIVHPDGAVEPDEQPPVLRSRRSHADTSNTDTSNTDTSNTDTSNTDTSSADTSQMPMVDLAAAPRPQVQEPLDVEARILPATVIGAVPDPFPLGMRAETRPEEGRGAVERPTTRREARQSFLTRELPDEPAAKGVRGLLSRTGVRMGPSAAERQERADVLAVSQHWPGPRTIAIVNGKGGANKTPTTIMLAAVFARHGGAGVLTWDNNQTRGTLGWRTDQGPHEATVLELLPQTDRLLSTGAQSADLARYVHHQTRDRFDVLRSKPMALAHEQRLEPADVDAIHAVAAKYYRLIFMDSGNDESDPMWLRMIDLADQLVVATTTRDDHAEAGALLLEALADRDQVSAALAQKAVVIVSQADPKASTADVRRTASGFATLAGEAVTIPFDPAMVDGVLHHGSLRPATRRAWLAAGAAVARSL